MEISGISNYILDKKCPNCDGQTRISLNDIIEERIIICPTCHTEMRPVNAEKIAKEAKQKIDTITREVQELLKNIKLEAYRH
ncbi:MAG: hypothetical protein JW928_07470 [Candidatus Aureabacteria bacterium]|nr:hypothetical protein [Candidatus Auribacterota bacterium]